MKISFAALSAFILNLFFVPVFFAAFAQAGPCPPGFESLCGINFDNTKILGNLIQLLIIIAILVSLIFLTWGGIKWITSNGDKAKVEQARAGIIASIVGLLIAILAFFIVQVLTFLFTGSSSINLPIPKLV